MLIYFDLRFKQYLSDDFSLLPKPYLTYLLNFKASNDNKCTNNKTICEPIIINWIQRPPYIFSTKDNNNEIRGILPKVMEAIVNHCCGPCQEIKYNVQVQEESQLLALNGIYIIIVGEIFYTIYLKLFWTIITVYPAFQTRSLFNSIFPPLLSLIR